MRDKNYWANGSLELINHGENHIKQGKEFDLRIAMISIDNSVELSIKTYLSKNRRSLNLGRKTLEQSKRYFPQLLDIFEKYNQINISKEDLDAIEFYHSIRNNLYHEGVGITVEKSIVEIYFILANDLISKLFTLKEKSRPIPKESYEDLESYEDIGEFSMFFNLLESALKEYLEDYRRIKLEKVLFKDLINIAQSEEIISDTQYEILLKILKRRNDIVHRALIPSKDDLVRDIYFLDDILNQVVKKIEKEHEKKNDE